MSRRPSYVFTTDCINSDYDSIRDLIASQRAISREAFVRRIGREQWEEIQGRLGYDRDFPISRDWHVAYYEGEFQGLPAVFLRWSGVEYIYVRPNDP